MSPRSWKERIDDVLEAIAEIQEFTRSMTFEQFRDDPKTLKAVALDFVVIGEAAAHVPDDVADSHPEVAWNLMRGMRNRLVHDYFSLDAEIVWDTLRNDLPPLLEPLKRLRQTG
jgi:uncharacterized protein with HEPN domain